MPIMEQQELLDSLKPKVYIDSVTLEADAITVRISLYESAPDGEIASWFYDDNFRKYFFVELKLFGSEISDIIGTASISLSEEETREPEEIQLPDGTYAIRHSFSKKYNYDSDIRNINLHLFTSFDIDEINEDYGVELDDIAPLTDAEVKASSTGIIRNGVTIYPVQDFRIKAPQLSPLALPVQDFLASVQNKYNSASEKFEKGKKEKSSIISDFWITRSAQGTARFLFFFDAESYFENRSSYRKYFKRMDPSMKGRVVAHSQVPSLRIIRKRVDIIKGKTGNRVVDYKDKDYTTVVVETSKSRNSMSFLPINNTNAGIKQVDISTEGVKRDSRDFFNRNPYVNANIFFLTGTDKDIAQYTDGKYAYGVEITVNDTVPAVLLAEVRLMELEVQEIKGIYERLSVPMYYNAITDSFKPKATEDGVLEELNITPASHRLKSLMNVFAPGAAITGTTLEFFNQYRTQVSRLSSVKMFTDIAEEILSSISSDLGLPDSDFRSVNFGTTSALDKTTRFYMSPEKVFDSRIPKRTGLDYLADFSLNANEQTLREITSLSESDDTIGLKVIDGAQYQQRLTSEITRHFPSTGTPVFPPFPTSTTATPTNLLGTGSEYLTVSNVYAGSEVYTRNFESPDSTIDSEILLENMCSLEIRNLGSPRHPTSRQATILSSYNVIFGEVGSKTLLHENIGSTSGIPVPPPSSEIDYQEVTNSSSDFEEYIFSKLQEIISAPSAGTERTFRTTNFPESHRRSLAATAEDPSTVWLEDSLESDRIDLWNSSPTIIKSIALSSPSINTDFYQVSTNFLSKVQYMEGFGDRQGSLYPIWKSLTLDVYSENQDKNLLCRIVPAHEARLGVRTTNTGKPIFDSVFIIRPVANPMVETPTSAFIIETDTSQADAITNFVARSREFILNQISEAELEIIAFMREYKPLKDSYDLVRHVIVRRDDDERFTDFDIEVRNSHRQQEARQILDTVNMLIENINRLVVAIANLKRELLELS